MKSCFGLVCNHKPLILGEELGSILDDQSYILSAETYLKQCYGQNPNAQQCAILQRQKIEIIEPNNVSCLFDLSIYINDITISNITAFQVDTGILDSHSDFGINA